MMETLGNSSRRILRSSAHQLEQNERKDLGELTNLKEFKRGKRIRKATIVTPCPNSSLDKHESKSLDSSKKDYSSLASRIKQATPSSRKFTNVIPTKLNSNQKNADKNVPSKHKKNTDVIDFEISHNKEKIFPPKSKDLSFEDIEALILDFKSNKNEQSSKPNKRTKKMNSPAKSNFRPVKEEKNICVKGKQENCMSELKGSTIKANSHKSTKKKNELEQNNFYVSKNSGTSNKKSKLDIDANLDRKSLTQMSTCTTSKAKQGYDISQIDNSLFDDAENKMFDAVVKLPAKKDSSSKIKKDHVDNDISQKRKTKTCSKKGKSTNSKGNDTLSSRKGKENKLSESDESEWEEVDELNEILSADKDKPSLGVQIELASSSVLWGANQRKRRSHQELIQDYLRKKINRSIRKIYENQHKTHILCLLAYGKYANSCLNSSILQSCGLSMLNPEFISTSKAGIVQVEKLLKQFRKKFTFVPEKLSSADVNLPVEELLLKRFSEHVACSARELVLLFVIICRSVGIAARFVFNILPVHWKPQQKELLQPPKLKHSDDLEIAETPCVEKGEGSGPKAISKSKEKNFYKVISSDSESPRREKSARKKSCSSSDFEDEIEFNVSSRRRKKKVKTAPGKTKAALSEESGIKKNKVDLLSEWVEVFDCKKKKWFSIEVVKQRTDELHTQIKTRIPSNSAYIVAFNQDESLRDVTKRYIPNWLSTGRKHRCDSEWWSNSLAPFLGPKVKDYLEEERQMDEELRLQPLPKTFSEYKNHPLYALQRHLLKYQAIYPPDESPVGFFKGEPVFPRESVKTLHGRDNWIREAKTVKVDEEPYKVVNAIPKWDKINRVVIKDRPLELFGEWQVEDYEPPLAKNGKVPRNEYGNVDLFKSTMLPRGCVHLQVPGLNRVARKVGIDCVPAVIGFEFGSAGCRPLLDGFVVCEEFRDVLMDAWRQDQIEQERKQEEKRLKRIYGNWKKLINGILVKERIKEKYGEDSSLSQETAPVRQKNKEKKRKITQKDITALEESSSSAPIRLKIDMETSAAEATKRRLDKVAKLLLPNQKSKTAKASGRKAANMDTFEKSLPGSLSSESEDELSQEEKSQKIRSILQWEPSCQAALSDESDAEERTGEKRSESDNFKMPVVTDSQVKIVSKGVKRKRLSRPKKNTAQVRVCDEDDNDSSDSSSSATDSERVLSKRRSKRSYAAKEALYDERSECELSFDDSDDDRSYIPQKEAS